jgi:hypothetical protein
MSFSTLWKKELEGVTSLTLEGFAYGYYIYEPFYFNIPPNNKYELWLIKEDGTLNPQQQIYQFNTLEEAKDFAINHLKEL